MTECLIIYWQPLWLFPGELKEDSGLGVLAKQFEIDVDEVGVEGAKTFFEAKVHLDRLMQELLQRLIYVGFDLGH